MASIRCGHCKDTHESIQEVRACSRQDKRHTEQSIREHMRRRMEGPLFCGHIDKAGDLCAAALELTAANEPTHQDRLINLEHDSVPVSRGQLDRLRAGKPVDGMQLNQTQERRQQRVVQPVVEGFYLKEGVVFKVQKAVYGSGRLYAKELIIQELSELEVAPELRKPGQKFSRGTWEYAPSAIRHLTLEHKLTKEQAVELGKLYGMCPKCGQTLTKESSIEQGMGDVCAGKEW